MRHTPMCHNSSTFLFMWLFHILPLTFLDKFQRFVFYIIYNPFAVLFVMVCILLNTLTMALDHHMMDRELEQFLRCANYVSLRMPIRRTTATACSFKNNFHLLISIHSFIFVYSIMSFNSIMSPLIFLRTQTAIVQLSDYSCILLQNDECLGRFIYTHIKIQIQIQI